MAPDSYILDVDSRPAGLALSWSTDANAHPEPSSWCRATSSTGRSTPLAEVAGTAGVTGSGVVVGADRVVVTASTLPADPTAPLGSVTAVGTPVRQD